MFRVVFLTFHGARAPESVPPQHPEEEEPAAQQHAAPNHPAPRTHLHDAPPTMAFALIVLAIGSIVAGWAGLGGRFERFLAPSFGASGAGLQREEATGAAGLQATLMIASIAVALAGIGIAVYFFVKNRQAAARAAAQFPGVHRVLEHKYYVDEIYDAALVQPIRIASQDGLWKGIDAGLIDRAVNGIGEAVGGSSRVLRRMQTGSVRAYAASLFVGVVLILGYYLWR